ncbi:Protein CBG26838 [Caenorhabditis briggsae]|uniref:Protein CBG26838 n=1 Tax=Caenorhabditis briggsae TaxID=6238 RepID=B6ILR2_CAEBR|nr:Protein CBG26838 [Caenorhabditis briggsae]CAS00842.1 Protein CBG26838 [Caenorhabditis briggsae]
MRCSPYPFIFSIHFLETFKQTPNSKILTFWSQEK